MFSLITSIFLSTFPSLMVLVVAFSQQFHPSSTPVHARRHARLKAPQTWTTPTLNVMPHAFGRCIAIPLPDTHTHANSHAYTHIAIMLIFMKMFYNGTTSPVARALLFFKSGSYFLFGSYFHVVEICFSVVCC